MSVWQLIKEHTISPDKLQPGMRIAWHVKKWGMFYKAQIAAVEHIGPGKVRIKAGVSTYTYWCCLWHVLDESETIYLLGKS